MFSSITSGESIQTTSYKNQVKDTLSKVEKLLKENEEIEKQKERNCNKIKHMIKKLKEEEGEERLRVRNLSSLLANSNIPSPECDQNEEDFASSAVDDNENNMTPCTKQVASRKRLMDIDDVCPTSSKQKDKKISNAPKDISQSGACVSQSMATVTSPTDINVDPNVGGSGSSNLNSRVVDFNNAGRSRVDLNNTGRGRGDLKKVVGSSGELNKTNGRVDLNKTGRRMDSNKMKSCRVDLNKSVVECDTIMKRSVIKEIKAMNPIFVKPEVDLDKFECNLCNKSFSSAAPLTIHLESHYARSTTKFMDCTFLSCAFRGEQRNMIKHMRSKHTEELLFSCFVCRKGFYTLEAKSYHEAKHSKSELVWCGSCSRFNKVEHGGCKKCQRK